MLPQIRSHHLRHMHATLALQAGIHSKVVSERLGDATVSIALATHGGPGYRLLKAQTAARATGPASSGPVARVPRAAARCRRRPYFAMSVAFLPLLVAPAVTAMAVACSRSGLFRYHCAT